MINKTHIENVLRANGLSQTSSDDEIRSVLISASYNNDEVDSAVLVLRENIKSHKTHVDGLHKVFRSDTTLNSAEISALLGVDVDLEHHVAARTDRRQMSIFIQLILFFISVALAMLCALAYMYVMQIGVFHPSTSIALDLGK
jgi:hypothetical protein